MRSFNTGLFCALAFVFVVASVSGWAPFFGGALSMEEGHGINLDEVAVDVEEFSLPPQWIIIEELDKNTEKKIEFIYEGDEPKQIRLTGFTHAKPCGSGGIKDDAFWLQVWFVLEDGEMVMESEHKLGDNYSEVLVFDIDWNKVPDGPSNVLGVIVVDVAKDFEQTRQSLGK
jgi:hypothetical protein